MHGLRQRWLLIKSPFQRAVRFAIREEGGYSIDPLNPRSESKYGISRRTFPKIDVKVLTKNQAIDIYKQVYWERIKGDCLPPKLAVTLFDTAVHLGVKKAVKMLHKLLAIAEHRKVDANTVKEIYKAIERTDEETVSDWVLHSRLAYYASKESNPMFKANIKSWRGRVRRLRKMLEL